jgi:hypothetical protein
MKARASEQAAEQKALRKFIPRDESDPLWQIPEDSAPTMLIEGRRTPELFLTWELFNSLLSRAFPRGGESAEPLRRPIEQRAAALGFGRDLWPRLRKVAEPLLKLEAEQERLRRSPSVPASGYKLDAWSIHLCRVRAQAIADAKAEFGEEAFLRLLYEALAPEVQLLYGAVDPELADHLRFLEGGCR